ncbi:MAG: hypothetical protein CMO81_02355 [Waddliaceae bacterium]|nr:hypothetical protein [Waddliaceae bacterium]
MRFSISKEQLDFYQKHGFLELCGGISPEELAKINVAVESEITRRAKEKGLSFRGLGEEGHWNFGHDLWRTNSEIARVVCKVSFAQIGSTLWGERFLRLGNDQFIQEQSIDHKTLLELSSYQELVGGMALCLRTDIENEIKEPKEESLYLQAAEAGSMIFFSPTVPLHFLPSSGRYLLVTYCPKKTVYISRDSSPNNHKLKQQGYSFGDRLRDPMNPTLLRE